MKRTLSILLISSTVVITTFLAYFIQHRSWLKNEEKRIKEEMTVFEARSNYTDGVRDFMNRGYIISHRRDGFEKYEIRFEPRISTGRHDGWIAKQPDGSYYVKIW
jgi:hypothetical protein